MKEIFRRDEPPDELMQTVWEAIHLMKERAPDTSFMILGVSKTNPLDIIRVASPGFDVRAQDEALEFLADNPGWLLGEEDADDYAGRIS